MALRLRLLLCVVVSLLAVGCSKESGQDRTQEPPTENPTPDNPKPDEPKPDDGDDDGDGNDNGDNEGGDTTDGDELHLLAYGSPYNDITRAVPAGYSAYEPSDVTNIGLFMTPENTATLGYFLWNGTEWRSTISVKQKDYYVYGFSPGDAAKSATISPLDGETTYAAGAKLTLSELVPGGVTDFCIITGVQGVTSSSAPADVRLGQFTYSGQPSGSNYIYLLMDHFYACLQVRMSVNATYGELRTIKLKRMELHTTASTQNAVVTLLANDTGANPISNIAWTRNSGTVATTVTLFESTDGEALPEGGSAKVIEGQLLPAIGADVTLVSTYDVYDKGGNLIRKDCTATNLLPASLGYKTLAPGDRLPVNLTVNPTYIYMLSDPDLDNPSVTVN